MHVRTLSDWIEHDGNGMPVSGDTLVFAKDRSGYEYQKALPASTFSDEDLTMDLWIWYETEPSSDIVAYRTVM